MSQTQEVNPAESTDLYPRTLSPENRMRAKDVYQPPPHAEFTDGGEDVGMPKKEEKKSFPPDAIGTVTITTAGGGLLLGVPFGVAGAIIGGILGFALGFYNQWAKINDHSHL